MKKFILCVGCEKGGTTWLYSYLANHHNYHNPGKELNAIQRDDTVPSFPAVSPIFQQDILNYTEYFSKIEKTSGDFTHYEGSTENVFRIIKAALHCAGYEVVPVYILRDPIARGWSAFNMLGGGPIIPANSASNFLLRRNLDCKYIETIKALDAVFGNCLYFFYETFFLEENIKTICSALDIEYLPTNFNKVLNKGTYTELPSTHFIQLFGKTDKNIKAVDFVKKRFDYVPWNFENYKTI